MSTPIIEFRKVSKVYPQYHHLQGGLKNFLLRLPGVIRGLRSDRFVALRSVSFTIQKGETVGVIGRNGAGKSTILGLAAGVIKPTGGTVRVQRSPFPLLELGAGFHPDLTAEQNAVLNGMLLGVCRSRVRGRVRAIIEFAELEDFADQPIRTFSSGMLARLGFSIVTQLDPDLLLIDEVLAVGDIGFQEKCLDVLRAFKKQGRTILFVTHALRDVENMCDRALWIEKGQVWMDGPARAVAAAYRREATGNVRAVRSA